MGRPWSSEKAQAALARAILFSREQSAAYLQLVLLLQENEHLHSSTWYLVRVTLRLRFTGAGTRTESLSKIVRYYFHVLKM